MLPLQVPEDSLYFGARQHNRNPPLGHGALKFIQPGQADTEHLLIQKQQGAQRLSMRGNGYLALDGKHGEKRLHLGTSHVARMPQAVKMNVLADPENVGLLGAQAIVQVADLLAQLVQ